MYRNHRTLMCYILAIAAPLAHFCGGGYMTVLLAAGAMFPLAALAGDGMSRISRVEAAAELIWLSLVLGTVLQSAGANWPGEKSEVVVPLAILLLGTLGGNRQKTARAGNTLYWLAVIPGAVILFMLVGLVDVKWLEPVRGEWRGELLMTLLLPVLIDESRQGNWRKIIVTGLGATGVAVLIQGGLGYAAGMDADSPVYELGRCIGTGGFEMLISVVLSISWYGFVCYIMGAVEGLGSKLEMDDRIVRAGVAIPAGMMLILSLRMGSKMIGIGCLIMWILIPILHPKNKSKKHEKRC